MRAWRNADKYGNAKLVVVHNHDGVSPPQDQYDNINKWCPDRYVARPNIGQDIAALRDTIRDRANDPWDVLFWAVDDNIPMRKDFLRAFVQPFEQEPNLGLVGNYWVRGSFYPHYQHIVNDHYRTSCFAISRKAAMKLHFPKNLRTKSDCYKFEWYDPRMNLTAQVRNMGFDSMVVCGDRTRTWVDTNEYVWDIGCLHMNNHDPRCRKDLWNQYEAQFEVIHP
jgi:hypothetical protein